MPKIRNKSIFLAIFSRKMINPEIYHFQIFLEIKFLEFFKKGGHTKNGLILYSGFLAQQEG